MILLCLFFGILPFIIFVYGLFFFDFSFDAFQPLFYYSACAFSFLTFMVDGVSLLFILLVLFVFPICLFTLNYYSLLLNRFFFFLLLVVLELFLICVFLFSNLLAFYIFFEATLIPMFLLIGYFGSRFRKIKAAYYLFFYTFIGSVFMLLGLFSLYVLVGSLSFYMVFNFVYDFFFQKIL